MKSEINYNSMFSKIDYTLKQDLIGEFEKMEKKKEENSPPVLCGFFG
jgi:hypothetical protein